jgi:myo-inositol-1(or 4)-monophosphatase
MTAMTADWLGSCRRAAEAVREMLEARPTTREREVRTGGRGEGGDETLAIDSAAEDAVFAELEQLHEQGARFVAISEERGRVDFGSPQVQVVVDPIDGSLNAKRGLGPYALSVAVADGPTMADVFFAYVYDLARGEEWTARRGAGALLDGAPMPAVEGERRSRQGRLELLAVESADPRWMARSVGELERRVHRLRALGSIAVALCQLAAGRVDAMLALWGTRSVDAAAAQLIVRESGGFVAFGAHGLAAPLDLSARYPLAAARTQSTLEELVSLSTLTA